jgi:hypothetical protein
MYIILVKTHNKPWSINMSGPFDTRKEGIEAAKKLHEKLNITHKRLDYNNNPIVYQFSVQHIDKDEANGNIVSF